MNKSGGVILLYHRVAALDTDPQLLAVTPAKFAAQMQVLKELARPMRLSEMVDAVRRGHDLRHTAAVTFDDGYADNLRQARPILLAAGIPATVFVATGGTDSNREFFWDELDRIFLQANRLPRQLALNDRELTYEADLNGAAEYSRQECDQFRNWNVTLAEDPTARQRLYRELCATVHRSTIERRRVLLDQVRQWAGIGPEGRATHRMMTAEQLREIAHEGLIELGGHTVNHPLLASETIDVQHTEISRGRAALQGMTHQRICGFSYPFGGRRDYTEESVAAAKSGGFDFACSNFPGVVDRQTDPFQLPRMLVRDWDAAEFKTRLTRWLSDQG
jgi:peptidoglycan/xylan/chitin deacetylase (PgdA/CDA1 family)